MDILIPGLVAGGKKAAITAIKAAVNRRFKKKNKRQTQKGRGLKRYYHARR